MNICSVFVDGKSWRETLSKFSPVSHQLFSPNLSYYWLICWGHFLLDLQCLAPNQRAESVYNTWAKIPSNNICPLLGAQNFWSTKKNAVAWMWAPNVSV